MSRAQVIFLNGASSTGKSAVAKIIQARVGDVVFLHVPEDMFFDMLPPGAHDRPDFMTVGMRLYTGFAECVALLAAGGSHVVVDTVAWVEGSIPAFLRAFEHTTVLAVGLHCDPAELRRREEERADRRVGLAEQQAVVVHQGWQYDLEVDTTTTGIDEVADRIVEAWQAGATSPSAFERMREVATEVALADTELP
jgi:chloramphenicol 3-O phosphotransferase